MSDQLKSKTLSGLFWSFFELIGQQGIQFVIQIILARLLMPEEFGLIAMLTIFMAIAQSFLDSGFGSALIQKQDATSLDESSIFYFNILVGIIATALLWVAAPWIAAFYKIPILTPMTQALSLNLIINSFGLIQTVLLTKQVDFKAQMKISILAVTLSGVIGVGMAYKGFGVWSLVGQSLTNNIFRTIFLWFFSAWQPQWKFSYKSLVRMFPFGSKLLLSGLLDTLFNNMYLVVIGKVFSPTDLGFYSRAKGMQQLPVNNISIAVARVAYPVFSTVQDDKPRLKRGVKKSLMTLSLINFPMMIGLAVVAKPLVHVLLTDKWLPSVPYLQLLCVATLLYPLAVINLNVLKAQGRSDLFLRLEILKKIIAVTALIITYRWGIIAMIYGRIGVSIIGYFLNSYYNGKLLNYSIFEQTVDILPMMALSGVMGGAVYLLNYMPLSNQGILLILQIIFGASLYTLLCWLFKLSSFVEILDTIKPKIESIRSAF